MATERATRSLKPASRRERLTDQAFEAIRASILSGEFGPGVRLVEMRLAESLEVSRAPVREALQRLVQIGLVEERPHLGSVVCTLTARDVADLYNVRVGLETVAIRLFVRAQRPTAPLTKIIQSMERAAARGARVEVVQAEMQFHRHIVEEADNALLARLFREVEGRALLALALDDETFEDLRPIAEEHVPLLEAIESGDEARAVAACAHHITSTVGHLLDRLGGDRRLVPPPL